MNLTESAKQNLQSFETTISSVMDGLYWEEFTALLLQVNCKNIQMEAEIAMALNPDGKLDRLRRFIGELLVEKR